MPSPRNGPGILITRTQPGADRLAATLTAEGYRPFISPALSVSPTGDAPPDLEAIAACLFTSAHAIAYITASPLWPRLQNLPLYTIGMGGAAELEKHGARNITAGTGDIHAIARIMADNAISGPVLHVRGHDVAADTDAALAQLGLPVADWCVYRTTPATALDPVARTALETGGVRAVLFHSAAGAAAFSDMVRTQALENRLEQAAALCISQNVLDSIAKLPFAVSYVSDVPSHPGMMALIGRAIPVEP